MSRSMLNKYNVSLLLISFLGIGVSFTYQFVFNYEPCELCYYLRYLYGFVVLLSFLSFIKDVWKIMMTMTLISSVLILIISIYIEFSTCCVFTPTMLGVKLNVWSSIGGIFLLFISGFGLFKVRI